MLHLHLNYIYNVYIYIYSIRGAVKMFRRSVSKQYDTKLKINIRKLRTLNTANIKYQPYINILRLFNFIDFMRVKTHCTKFSDHYKILISAKFS